MLAILTNDNEEPAEARLYCDGDHEKAPFFFVKRPAGMSVEAFGPHMIKTFEKVGWEPRGLRPDGFARHLCPDCAAAEEPAPPPKPLASA